MAHWLWLFWIASSKAPSFLRSKENPIGLVPQNRKTLLPIYPPRHPHKPRRFCFTSQPTRWLPLVRQNGLLLRRHRHVIDGCRNGVASNGFTGVNEVRLRNGRTVREGLKTTLSDMRLAKQHRSAKARWQAQVGAPSLILVSRERAKLSYFWRHAYGSARSGRFNGSV